MSRPFFSVVMAVQNGMPHLSLAMESLFAQTFGGFEVIVVDDHSRDGTTDYLRALQDPRLKVIDSPFEGQTPALNVGIEQAQADWIARMDGDDWCDPRRLALQKAAIEGSADTPVMVTSDYVICDEDLKPVSTLRLAPPNPRLRRYLETKNNPFCHPTVIFERAAAARIGNYDVTIRNAQDYRLWLALLRERTWVHVHEPLVKYRVRRGSLSVLYQPEQLSERRVILSQRPSEAITHASTASDTEGTYQYKLGFAAWVGGERSLAVRHLIRSYSATRLYRAKIVILLALTLLPRRLRLLLAGYHGVYR